MFLITRKEIRDIPALGMSDFLSSLKGTTAIVVGGGEGLANALRQNFSRVISSDPSRTLTSASKQKQLREGEVLFVSGDNATPDHLPGNCDLIVLAFLTANRDDPQELIEPWIKLLGHRGQLVLIEWASRQVRSKSTPNALHTRVLNELEDAGRFHPPGSREMVRWLQGSGLVHTRQVSEAAGEIFEPQDLAYITAEAISEFVQLGRSDDVLVHELRSNVLDPAPVTFAYGTLKRKETYTDAQLPEPEAKARALTEAEELVELPDEEAGMVERLAAALVGSVENPERVAHRLLHHFGVLALPTISDPQVISHGVGIDLSAAKRVLSVLEIGRVLFEARDRKHLEVHGPEDAYRYLKPQMSGLTQEHFRGLYLNVKGKVIADEIISIGTLTSSLVHPREVFGPALEGRCHAVLIAHNHPSGDPNPSPEDIHISRELAEAGKLLGIELLDHIVIGRDSYISLKERSLF